MNTRELSAQYPDAFSALPEPYQADDCLYFWFDGGDLYCRPAEGQENVLGNWEAVFWDVEKLWYAGLKTQTAEQSIIGSLEEVRKYHTSQKN